MIIGFCIDGSWSKECGVHVQGCVMMANGLKDKSTELERWLRRTVRLTLASGAKASWRAKGYASLTTPIILHNYKLEPKQDLAK